MPNPTRPIGRPTKGKTTRNRLRRVDIFLIRYASNLIKRQDGDYESSYFIDLGFGKEPHTTLESANQFKKINPQIKVLGVEIDPERVEAAQTYQTDDLKFRHGGFNLPLYAGESARMIRVFNVLRQYDESQVSDAYRSLMSSLLPEGLLIEGTSDPYGRLWTANLVRKTTHDEPWYQAFVLSTNFRWGFEPTQLQSVLPKNLIHHLQQGEPIERFFSDWKESTQRTIGHKQYGLRQWFTEAAHTLQERGYHIDTRKKFLRSGFLVWKYPEIQLLRPADEA